jgi:transcription termination/antitermination protein NusA
VSRDFVGALLQLNAEKQVSREALVRALEEGIQAAYRRVAGEEDIWVQVDQESGRIRVFRGRIAVDEVEDPLVEFTLEEARTHKPDAQPGDLVHIEELDGEHFGRIGAQTAKQIILQRIREVERDQVFDQFANREGELITGTVSRVEPRAIILDVGKNVEAILATSEQSPLEHYRIGQPVKAFVLEVRRSARGPQILVSRTHKGFLRRLFELEVPEIHAGTVEVKAIAREAGSRSKMAVGSRQEGLDPVGATVGQRGARVQAVVAEVSGEKIDVIPWSDDPSVFVANALSPAQVLAVDIDEEHRIANVTVPERMLSLAIGRGGENARLAARLTGWRIDIRSDVAVAEAAAAPAPVPEESADLATAEAESLVAEAVLEPGADAVPAPQAAAVTGADAGAPDDGTAAPIEAPTDLPAPAPADVPGDELVGSNGGNAGADRDESDGVAPAEELAEAESESLVVENVLEPGAEAAPAPQEAAVAETLEAKPARKRRTKTDEEVSS